MPLRAILKTRGGEFSDGLTSGRTRVARYWVNTRDEIAAVGPSVIGLPRNGDAFSPSEPFFVVTDRRARSIGGVDNASGENGTTEVVVTYTDLAFSASSFEKEVQPIGTKHTVITVGNETVDAGNGFTDSNAVDNSFAPLAFNNGKNASRLVGRVSLEVYDFRPKNYEVPFAQLFDLACDKKINSDAITAPPVLGTTQSLSIPVGAALYMGFRVEARPNDVKLIVHQLDLNISASGWRLSWFVTRADGGLVTVPPGVPLIVSTNLYKRAPFAGLW